MSKIVKNALTSVLHIGQSQEGSSRVQDRYTNFGNDGSDDSGFLECAGTRLAEWEEDTLEERLALVQRLLEGHVQMVVQFLIICNIVPNLVQQHQTEELVRLLLLQVGGE